jgi:RNA polymerase sigma-70 factor (ECF subfamily)
MANNSGETVALLERARAGDGAALTELFTRHRERLRRLVQMRLDRRLQARIDASDVIQDAYFEVATRLPDYFRSPTLPFFLWLRLVVGEQLTNLHRQHLGTQMRDAGREVSLYRDPMPGASSAALAAQLLGKQTSPTQAALRAERLLRLQDAVNLLDPLDREVLSLRHFEQLTRAETAKVLGIEEGAALKKGINYGEKALALEPDRPLRKHNLEVAPWPTTWPTSSANWCYRSRSKAGRSRRCGRS